MSGKIHLPALDGLRGIAALWVLLGHVIQNVPFRNGFVWPLLNAHFAVDLFMILSGFLMFYLHHEPDRARPSEFLLRRFFRLAPVYYICLILGMMITPWFHEWTSVTWSRVGLSGWPLVATPLNFLYHLSFLFGISPEYQQTTPMPDWSLSLEAQFYIAFPFLVLAIGRFGLVFLSLALLVASAVATMLIEQSVGGYVFPSLLPLKLNIFIAGMLLARLALKGFDIRIAALAVVAVGFSAGHFSLPHLMVRELLLFVVYACVMPKPFVIANWIRWACSLPLVKWAGAMSYGVYLTHLTFMYGAFYLLIPSLGEQNLLLFVGVATITIVGSYGFAALLHYWVELPGIGIGRRFLRARLIGLERI